MQESSPAIPHWMFQVLQGLAFMGLGGFVIKLIDRWQNRQRPKAQVHKVEAETTEIIVRSHATAGDAMGRMIDRLESAVATNDRLRSERDDLQELTDKQAMELESYERQMKRMKAMMDIKGIKISDFDEPKE